MSDVIVLWYDSAAETEWDNTETGWDNFASLQEAAGHAAAFADSDWCSPLGVEIFTADGPVWCPLSEANEFSRLYQLALAQRREREEARQETAIPFVGWVVVDGPPGRPGVSFLDYVFDAADADEMVADERARYPWFGDRIRFQAAPDV